MLIVRDEIVYDAPYDMRSTMTDHHAMTMQKLGNKRSYDGEHVLTVVVSGLVVGERGGTSAGDCMWSRDGHVLIGHAMPFDAPLSASLFLGASIAGDASALQTRDDRLGDPL
jgi:hypothetical protein